MDNRYFNYNCPALMQDARFITNYTSPRINEQYIRTVNKINSAQDYKLFLQVNGGVILENEKKYFETNNICALNPRCPMLAKNLDNSTKILKN